MATTVGPQSWKTGYMLPSESATWQIENHNTTEQGVKSHYIVPPDEEPVSSTAHNSLGVNKLRTWPTMYNGTKSPRRVPDWWKPSDEVDVLICGAGPFGLQVALSLARQGVSFRIIDKAQAPLLAGRADCLQPRSFEFLHSWGLAEEILHEGPFLNHTCLYKDGELLAQGPSPTCDSRYPGCFVAAQGVLEKMYIRDLLRHRALVERNSVVDEFNIDSDPAISHPVRARVQDLETAETQTIRAKYLVGAEGASSSIRKQLNIPFDGTTTDIHWGIIECKFETDYPSMHSFGIAMNAKHGASISVPREQGYHRIYTKLSPERVSELAEDRREAGGRVDAHSITPEEVLEQTNRNFAPYKLSFAAPLSWFAVWKISERVARSFSSPDLRVHLGGDAAHVHSVMGAMGLNSSIYDASNLGWKLGLCARGMAKPSALLPSYDLERRLFANRVIRASGAYLRFILDAQDIPLAQLRGTGDDLETYMDDLPRLDGTRLGALKWTGAFFGRNSKMLVGMEVPYTISTICPATKVSDKRPITIENGRRAPNPHVCITESSTGYLYDRMTGAARFHILVFASDLQGPVRERIARFSQQALGPNGFYTAFGGADMFNIVLIFKCLPFEKEDLLKGGDLDNLRERASVVFDDRPPDEDAAYCYGINHARGAIVAVRPDLWVGTSCWPEESHVLEEYFGSFLVEKVGTKKDLTNRLAEEKQRANVVDVINGYDDLRSVEQRISMPSIEVS